MKATIGAIDIYELNLHDVFIFDNDHGEVYVTRVAGGWIYQFIEENGNVHESNPLGTTFVPFNNEFMDDESSTVKKTPLGEWILENEAKLLASGSTGKRMSGIAYYINEYKIKDLFMEDVTRKEFLMFRNIGVETWRAFQKIRGY